MIPNSAYALRLVLLGMTWFVAVQSGAAVKLPALFSDRMVLQQQSNVSLWGWAAGGEMVTVKVPWQRETIRTKTDVSGKWKVLLPTPQAGGPYVLTISGENTISLQDVLIGEVWICSGQSNMTFPLRFSNGAKEAISSADFPSIRYFGVKRQYGPEPFEDCSGSSWEKTTPLTAPSFSAVAFYFARKLWKTKKVPIGIVCAGWSGTPAEAWTPRAVLQRDDSLRYFLRRWTEIPQRVGIDSMQYHQALDAWEKNRNAPSLTALPKPAEPRTYYYYHRPWCEPGFLYNRMIHPLIPYSVKGFLWYQGESNVSEAGLYERLFTALIQSWLHSWARTGRPEDLPFYFVQIAPFGYDNLENAARLRHAQHQVMEKVERTGMAVTLDVGDMSNIHPAQKMEVGERLAAIALAESYGDRQVPFKGPVCTSLTKVRNKLVLQFDQPLSTTGDNPVQGFELGYKDTSTGPVLFVKAKAIIKGKTLTVWNEEVHDPFIVRYAWLDAGEANLMNKAGLPAYTFRRQAPLVRKMNEK